MGFAEDKVYDHILKNLRKFKNIRVASLADSLSCLTDADRDELHSREETRGSQATVYRFYQHLRCRQGWVLDLIDALRQNNAGHLADELQHVYYSWQACPPAPPAAAFPPAAQDAHSTISAQPLPSLGPNPAPLAEQPRRDLPAGDRPPLLPSAASTTSTDLEARAPVQESLPQTFLQPESRQPPPPGSVVHDGASNEHGREGLLSPPTEAVQVAPGTPGVASVAMPSAVPAKQDRDWLSGQQHPVCVDKCFGNASHLHSGTPGSGPHQSLPAREADAPCRNEPEENFYVSTESPPRLEEAARVVGPQHPNSLPQNQAGPSSEQLDGEQKRIGMLQKGGRDGDTQIEKNTPVATPAPRDTSPSRDASLKALVEEEEPPTGEVASSTPSMLARQKVPLASADPLPLAAGSFEGRSGRTSSQESSATSIWVSCIKEERDVELSKPGVLHSMAGESPEVASRYSSSREPRSPYSRASDSLSFSSDPLLVSTDSSSSGGALSRAASRCPAPVAYEDTGGEEVAGASWGSTSVSTHEVRVDHCPSAQLGAGCDLRDRADPLGNPLVLDSSWGRDTATGLSQATVPPGDSNGSSLPYVLPAVGIAVISALAFLVYNRLQK
ncbi:MAVS protein, partial [Bucorvus abyssinicus]|nr:MAVS protein [Bucorvus abyssinicus]